MRLKLAQSIALVPVALANDLHLISDTPGQLSGNGRAYACWLKSHDSSNRQTLADVCPVEAEADNIWTRVRWLWQLTETCSQLHVSLLHLAGVIGPHELGQDFALRLLGGRDHVQRPVVYVCGDLLVDDGSQHSRWDGIDLHALARETL